MPAGGFEQIGGSSPLRDLRVVLGPKSWAGGGAGCGELLERVCTFAGRYWGLRGHNITYVPL